MKIDKGNVTFKILAGGLGTAMLWINCPAAHLAAQTAPVEAPAAAAESGRSAADHTMTIVRYLENEVYEIEGKKVVVDQYQIKRGDSMVKLLRERGLLNSWSKAKEAELLGFVRILNPELKNLSALVPGQIVKLPLRLEDAAADQTTPAPRPQLPSTETVKEYERPSHGGQKSARVKVMVHKTEDLEEQNQAPAVQEADQNLKKAAAAEEPAQTTAPAETTAAASANVAGQTPGAVSTGEPGQASVTAVSDFPSGNPGVLAMEPASKVVYRTVKVRRGDSLERLLRREGMHRDLIYGHLLKVTMELNPDIKHPDLIMTGAEIKIPAAGDYLTAMAGVNPQEVKSAALAISERRRPEGGGAGRQSGQNVRAAVLELPNEAMVTAKNTLGLIFTRLGDKVDSRGTVLLPAGTAGVELDTSAFPVVELSTGVRLVLDPGSRLSQAAIRKLREHQPPYHVFRTGKKETLERALGRLWPLCGYFRVYTKDRTYEGGGDIKLQIAADWMIWTTKEAWNSGQPMVINRAKSPDLRTSPAWSAFLEAHGIKVMDIHGNQLLPTPEAPSGSPELAVVSLGDTSHPTLLAAELVKNLGAEPRVGVQVDLARAPGQNVAPNVTAPVLWEDGATRVVMEFGELPPEAIQTLRQNGYRVISSAKDTDAVIYGVLGGFGLKARDGLVLNAPAGGPKMSLSIKGKLVTRGDRKYLLTQAPLPSGLVNLIEPGLKILKY